MPQFSQILPKILTLTLPSPINSAPRGSSSLLRALGLGLGGSLLLSLSACGGSSTDPSKQAATSQEPSPEASSATGFGLLEVRANGEDFVREGFTTKDGWEVSFDHVYVSLAEVTALQTDPPFDPDSDEDPQVAIQERLEGDLVVDLAAPEAPTALVGSVPQASSGRYNALAFQVVVAEAGPAPGQSFRLVGTAQKAGETVEFTLDWDQAYAYRCGDFIGDQRKGILKDGDRADLEATFHFDHVFGDADTPPEDALNQDALGFEPLAQVASGGRLTANRDDLKTQLSPEAFARLDKAMAGLAHVGEGHCREVSL